MPGNDAIQLEGRVTVVLPAGRVRVDLANGHQLVARVTMRRRQDIGALQVGDRVVLAVSPGDMSQGTVETVLERIAKNESSRVS